MNGENPYEQLPTSPLSEDRVDSPALASPWIRLGARMIDQAAFWLPPVAVGLVLIGTTDSDWTTAVLGGGMVAWMLVLFSIQVWLLATQGQSVGKRALGVRIVNAQGQPPGFLRAGLAREGARIGLGVIPYLSVITASIDSLMIFGRDRRTLHDRVAGTWVVSLNPDSTAPRLGEVSAGAGSGVPAAAVVVLGGLGLVAAIGCSAAVAIPNFIAMQLKAKRSEVPTNVDAIRTAELAYQSANGQFIAAGSSADALAWAPGKARRPWPGGAGWDELGWSPGGDVRGAYWVELVGDDFLVRGMADVDGDGQYAVYQASSGEAAHMVSDANNY